MPASCRQLALTLTAALSACRGDDRGGLATPAAMVRDNNTVLLYFAYEGLPVSAGLRGIGIAKATHPLGPFERLPPAAVAPVGWHRPKGPGGIFDDPEVMHFGGRYHLFHSRKHITDRNCSWPGQQGPPADHCAGRRGRGRRHPGRHHGFWIRTVIEL